MLNPQKYLLRAISKVGYVLKYFSVSNSDGTRNEVCEAYNVHGQYIGSESFAISLIEHMGIMPEYADPREDTVCSIGYCPREGRWYGYTPSAITCFGVGDRIFDVEYGDDKTLPWKRGYQTITTMEEAKMSAIKFARYQAGREGVKT